MELHYIEYNNKEYKIEEPTIELWNRINNIKNLSTEKEFLVYVISLATGLPPEDVYEADWESVNETAQRLADYFLDTSEKFYNEFEFKGKKYRFIDLDNLTFGEFIDIDEFLSRPEIKRQTELNFLMALLYREVDEKGKLTPYNADLLKDRAELFKKLPVRYLKGSMRFFFHLERILHLSTRSFLAKIYYRTKWKMRTLLRATGGGIQRSYIYLTRTFYKYKRRLSVRYWRSLIF